MIYLNWNIEKVESALLDRGAIEKIAKMRAADSDIGEASIGGLVSVRLFQPDYDLSISYSQSGNYDNYKETEALHIDLSRENIFDNLDDVSYDEDKGKYYDSFNKEYFTYEDLVDLALENGAPSLFEDTKNKIKYYIEEFKENAEKCPVCNSTNVKKSGHKHLMDGVHQQYECMNENKEEHPSGKPRHFYSEWIF